MTVKRQKKIKKLGDQYTLLGRILQDNTELPWEDVVEIALVETVAVIKELTKIIFEQRKMLDKLRK